MTREIRHLTAMYFIFTLFLAATVVEEGGGSIPAAGGHLARMAPPPPPPLAAILRATMQRPGFSPVSAPLLRGWRITPRDGTPLLVWSCAVHGEAKEALRRLGTELTTVAEKNGAGLLRSGWGFRAGRLCLYLDFRREGEETVPVCLQAMPAEMRVTRVLARADLPEVKPLPRPRPTPEPTPGPTIPRPTARPVHGPRVAIVLDDVGTVAGTERFLALPIPLTIAVLPYTPYGETYARQAVASGHLVMLHQPLETIGGQEPGRGTIRIGWPPDRIRAQLEENLLAVPGARGVNNHMGSRGTADVALMTEILKAVKAKGLFFLDSLTWRDSVAFRVARSVGARYAVRDVFLDPDGASVAAIQAMLRDLIFLARKRGGAVGICHANRPNTLAALEATLPEFAAAGVEVVPLDELVHD